MLTVNKLISCSPVDYAAEELKKYFRMMMPEGGDVSIAYDPEAKDGFRLGLMQDLGLDVSDAEDTELDDIIYIETDTRGALSRAQTLARYFLRYTSISGKWAAAGYSPVLTANIFL